MADREGIATAAAAGVRALTAPPSRTRGGLDFGKFHIDPKVDFGPHLVDERVAREILDLSAAVLSNMPGSNPPDRMARFHLIEQIERPVAAFDRAPAVPAGTGLDSLCGKLNEPLAERPASAPRRVQPARWIPKRAWWWPRVRPPARSGGTSPRLVNAR